MDKNFASRRDQGHAIEVKRVVDMSLGRWLWVDSRPAQQIESDKALRKHFVPHIQWKVWVSGTQARNKVILECTDGTFGCVATSSAPVASLSRRWRRGLKPRD
jgi:hypothetical protein